MRELYRDPNLLRQLMEQRLLRAVVSATGTLERVARGRTRFKDDDQRTASLALARLAPQLMPKPEESNEESERFWNHDIWAPDRIPAFEFLMPNCTREDFADFWAESFKTHGPTDDYSTLEEAREFGRQRFDDPNVKKQNDVSPQDEEWLKQRLNQSNHDQIEVQS